MIQPSLRTAEPAGGPRREESRASVCATPRAGVFVLITAVFLAIALLYRDFSVDDAYIFLVYAKHLATTGQMAFNLGEPVNGISSPLWFWVTFLAYKLSSLFGSLDMAVVVTRLASGVCTWAGTCVFAVLVFRLFSSTTLRALAIALFLADPWLWRWAFSGMEIGLAVLLINASLLLRGSRNPLFRLWSPLLLISLGALTRPELAVLGLLAMIDYLSGAGRERPPLRAAILSAVGAAAPPALWAWFAHATMGSVLPQTAAVKSGVLTSAQAFRYAAQVLISSQAVALALCAIGSIVWLWSRATRQVAPAARTRPHSIGLWPYALWILLLPAFYVSRGYAPLSRYLLMIMPSIVLVSITLMGWASEHVRAVRPRLGRLAFAAGLVAWTVWGFVTVERVLPVSGGQMEDAYRVAGRWIRKNTPESSRIAAGEIGVLAYYADRYMVDFGGLVLPADQLAVWRRDQASLLAAVKPEYTMTPCNFSVAGVRYVPVLKWSVPGHRASLKRDWVDHVLYRSTWTGASTR